MSSRDDLMKLHFLDGLEPVHKSKYPAGSVEQHPGISGCVSSHTPSFPGGLIDTSSYSACVQLSRKEMSKPGSQVSGNFCLVGNIVGLQGLVGAVLT